MLKIIALVIGGFVGIWLVLWDFIDWLTQGLNDGIWEQAILINGFPSIALGVCIIIAVTALGVTVFRG